MTKFNLIFFVVTTDDDNSTRCIIISFFVWFNTCTPVSSMKNNDNNYLSPRCYKSTHKSRTDVIRLFCGSSLWIVVICRQTLDN